MANHASEALIKKYKANSKRLTNDQKQDIIREYSTLVKFVAQKIAVRLPANIELDDLMSAGVIGLMDAIDKYDPARDNKFKTYAEFRVRGAILDELRAQDWIPRSMREKAKNIERSFSKLEQKLGRMASEEEVAKDLGMDIQEFQATLHQCKSVSLLSLDEVGSFSNGDRKSLLGLLEAGKDTNPLVQLAGSELREQLAESIEELPEKQRMVLSLYYYEDMNLKEIGEILEVTESRVSQLHTQAVLRLRSKLKEHLLTDDLS
ncbi:FliA/WhiG family RNA polymerase sigma factor [bacterium]|nr:FliA/WhiG family RNA polymerase sigma factor [bacterium]